MLRNSKGNLFYFRFPKDFVPKEVEDKYQVLLKRYAMPYITVQEYLNSLVISTELPSIDLDLTNQMSATQRRNFRPGLPTSKTIENSFNVVLKLTEGFLSYFMLLDIIKHWNENESYIDKYLPTFVFKTLDFQGYTMADIVYEEVLFSSISNISISYSEVTPSFNNFTVGFRANKVSINPNI